MRSFRGHAAYVATHPGVFALRVLRAFRANEGLLLAGAVAYYTLLSIVPLLILILIALSQIIAPGELLATLGRYLEWLIPGQSTAMIGELARFLEHRGVVGWALLVTMIFFSVRSPSRCWKMRCPSSSCTGWRFDGATFWCLRSYPIATSSFWGWAFC